jgi:DNA anti-recombination protein RmuC
MSEHYSAPSVPKLAPRDPDSVSADPALVLKLQQAAQIANENCDRAMALAHKLSAELRKAQSRINHLEREADELVHQQRMEAETAVAKLQSDTDARIDRVKAEADRLIERIKSEADKRVARAEASANEHLSRVRAEVDTRFSRLEADLVQAECRADRAEQWLVVIHREIEERLMPSFTDMHDRLPPPEGD